MNIFSSLEDQPVGSHPVQSGYAAAVARGCAESTVQNIMGALNSLYERAGQIGQTGIACRQCSKCCRHRLVTACAVEVAYLLLSASEPLNFGGLENHPCPALTAENSCDRYSARPLACRVFQPWSDWSPIKGCHHYPSNRDSSQKLNALLNRLTELNYAFVRKLGLQRNLDFDYLGQWAIADWFTDQEGDINAGGRWSL